MKWNLLLSQNPDSAPPPRYGHIAFIFKDDMYIHGGTSDTKSGFDDMYALNLKTKTWRKITPANPPSGRFFHSSKLLNSNTDIVFGGCSNQRKGTYNNTFSFFNPADESWQTATSSGDLPSPRCGTEIFFSGDQQYLIGGFSDPGGYVHHEELYVLSIDGIKVDSKKIFQRAEAKEGEPEDTRVFPKVGRPLSGSFIQWLGRAVVFGGYDPATKRPVSTLYSFDPKTTEWSPIPIWRELDLTATNFSSVVKSSKGLEPIPRYGHSCCIDDNEEIITVYGGAGSMLLGDTVMIDTIQED